MLLLSFPMFIVSLFAHVVKSFQFCVDISTRGLDKIMCATHAESAFYPIPVFFFLNCCGHKKSMRARLNY